MGENLAYLAFDAQGIKQVFILSPKGGTPRQLTEHKSSVAGGLRWHPSGNSLFYVHDGKIVQCKLGEDSFNDCMKYLTSKQVAEPTNIVLSHDGKILAFNRILTYPNGQTSKQIFILELL
jgi:Tol biopolymer transport system component